VARQLRQSLLNYMASDCFHPNVPVSTEQMRTLFFDNQIMKKLGAVAHANGESAGPAIDGDPNPNLGVALGIPREVLTAAPTVPNDIVTDVYDDEGRQHMELKRPLSELRDRILPVTSVIFDVKTVPDPALLVWNGLQILEVGSHRYRLDIDRRQLSPASAVKEIVNRFDVADLSIEEPQIEEVVKRIYREGIA